MEKEHTNKISAETLLMNEREKISILAELSADMIYEYDIATDTMYYMGKGSNILKEETVVQEYTKTIFTLAIVHPEDTMRLKTFCRELQQGKPQIMIEMRRKCADGSYRWYEFKGKTLYNDKGEPFRIIAKGSDIDDRVKEAERLKQRSEQDSLTGLYNSKTIKSMIRTALEELTEDEKGYLLFFDVDDFKTINDNMGHLFGDVVLCTFADELKTLFADGMAGRVGGDEFVAYVSNVSKEEVSQRIEILRARLGKLNSSEKRDVKISCSVGGTECVSGQNIDELFKRADSTLYYVKATGKGKLEFYFDDMQMPTEQGLYFVDNFKGAYKDKTALIQKDEDLILFAMELFDQAADTKSVLQLLADRICRYFGIDDIVCATQSDSAAMQMNFHWSLKEANKFMSETIPLNNAMEWDILLHQYDEDGISILRQEQIGDLEKSVAQSMMGVRIENKERIQFVFFVDRVGNRNWRKEQDVLKRLAEIVSGHMSKIDAERKQMDMVDRLLHYDPLTQLPLYSKFQALSQHMQEEFPEKDYYIIYADFSNFRYLNERYSYAEGDRVLEDFAKRLEEFTYSRICCRVTSNHFLALCSDVDVEVLCHAFLVMSRNFSKEVNRRFDNGNLCIVSGIAKVEPQFGNISAAIDNANMARKYVKTLAAESDCCVFTDDMRKQAELEMEICAMMEQALKKKEFHLYLQPKMELATGQIIGAEALVRWMKEDGSIIYPDQFIPIFERNGFVTKVDFCILEQVLELQRQRMEQGEELFPISVNFSRRHQEEEHFVEEIIGLLEKYNVPSKMLEAEITESIFMNDWSVLEQRLKALRQHGIAVSIDDFGSGYSSLNVLPKISADVIKLDHMFLTANPDTERSRLFIRNIIEMLKMLGFRVIAEGVETKRQMQFLKEVGCDYIQGYYLAKPMPVTEFEAFLKAYQAITIE